MIYFYLASLTHYFLGLWALLFTGLLAGWWLQGQLAAGRRRVKQERGACRRRRQLLQRLHEDLQERLQQSQARCEQLQARYDQIQEQWQTAQQQAVQLQEELSTEKQLCQHWQQQMATSLAAWQLDRTEYEDRLHHDGLRMAELQAQMQALIESGETQSGGQFVPPHGGSGGHPANPSSPPRPNLTVGPAFRPETARSGQFVEEPGPLGSPGSASSQGRLFLPPAEEPQPTPQRIAAWQAAENEAASARIPTTLGLFPQTATRANAKRHATRPAADPAVRNGKHSPFPNADHQKTDRGQPSQPQLLATLQRPESSSRPPAIPGSSDVAKAS